MGTSSLRFIRSLVPRVPLWDGVSCTELELVCCRPHQRECGLLHVVCKTELSFIFIVCLLGLSSFAERGDGACIGHSVAGTLYPGLQGHSVLPKCAGKKQPSRLSLHCCYSRGMIDKCLFLLGGIDIVSQKDVEHSAFPCLVILTNRAMSLCMAVLLPGLRCSGHLKHCVFLYYLQDNPSGVQRAQHRKHSEFQKITPYTFQRLIIW